MRSSTLVQISELSPMNETALPRELVRNTTAAVFDFISFLRVVPLDGPDVPP